MLDFLDTANGMKVLYEYISDYITEEDFFELLPEQYDRLEEVDKNQKWYIVNPQKLKTIYEEESSAFTVSEHEKSVLMRSIAFLKKISSDLPENASFSERMKHAKKFLPDSVCGKKERVVHIVDFEKARNDKLNE